MTDLPAGSELDALVAEKVMGWQGVYTRRMSFGGNSEDDAAILVEARGRPPGSTDPHDNVPGYSTDIAAAWLVVDRIVALGGDVAIQCDSTGFSCSVDAQEGLAHIEEISSSGPLSIARTALRFADLQKR